MRRQTASWILVAACLAVPLGFAGCKSPPVKQPPPRFRSTMLPLATGRIIVEGEHQQAPAQTPQAAPREGG